MKNKSVLISLCFGVIALLHFVLVFFDVKVFPAMLFPRFKNKEKVGEIHTKPVSIILYCKGNAKPVSLFNVLKPYDKRYYLFINRFLMDDSKRDSAEAFILNQARETMGCVDSLVFETGDARYSACEMKKKADQSIACITE